ncbi:MAG: hypothetical protein ACI4VQ_05615 [Clostridia bacterium]
MQKDCSKKKNYKKQKLIIILILVLCFITLASTFGRYVINGINNFFLRTKEFYFYSDKLKDTTAVYQIDNWTGIDPYTITVHMNSTENNLQKASYDISYDISYTCSDNATCQLSKTSGIISADTNSDYFNLIITPNTGLTTGDKVTVSITATSTAQYKKTLKAQFTLVVGKENLSYEIVDSKSNPYLDLNITNTLSYYNVETAFDSYSVGDKIDVDTYLTLSEENKNKCYSALITLEFDPEEVVLDMTNTNYLNATQVTTKNVNGINYINGITFKVEPISSAVVRFYKSDVTKDYTYPIVNPTSIITVTSR